MSDVKAGYRPKFDFPGSLELAAQMYDLATRLEGDNATRNEVWDEALDAWKGKEGDRILKYRTSDDTEMVETAKVLRTEADQWAALWAETVDEANAVFKAEAREVLKTHLDKADEGFQWHDIDDPFDGDEKKRKEGFDSVPAAANVGVPVGPSFEAPRSPFAHYERSGDSMIITNYSFAMPGYSGARYV